MNGKPTLVATAGAVLALAVLLLPATQVQAGCGCDHPPPEWTMVMPPFGSAGKLVQIFADAGDLTPGEPYSVAFGDAARVKVIAEDPNVLEVSVPDGLALGPVPIVVVGRGYERKYPGDLFTALPPALAVPPGNGRYLNRGYEAAIGADGTVLIPVDVGAVLDPTQFAMAFANLALVFGTDDIVIYNADGVDLTLFTAEVEDPTQREWGDYYGWEVEQDAGIYGVPYSAEAVQPDKYWEMSSILTYWRHEFYTYAAAHAPGGSHEVDEEGRHPDGTLHIDHEHLVLAVGGVERSKWFPWDLTRARRLEPGSRSVDLIWVSLVSKEPISVWSMALMAELDFGMLAERLPLASDYEQKEDDD